LFHRIYYGLWIATEDCTYLCYGFYRHVIWKVTSAWRSPDSDNICHDEGK